MRAFGAADLDVALGAFELALRHQRPELRRQVERIADADRARAPHHAFDQRFGLALVHEHARARDARLSRRDERGERRARGGAVEVRVGEHDHRRLAAQLARHAHEVLARELRDDAARFGAAGEIELAHAAVAAQRRARFGAESRDDVEDAVRDPRVARDARELQRRERRVLRRLHRRPRCPPRAPARASS